MTKARARNLSYSSMYFSINQGYGLESSLHTGQLLTMKKVLLKLFLRFLCIDFSNQLNMYYHTNYKFHQRFAGFELFHTLYNHLNARR